MRTEWPTDLPRLGRRLYIQGGSIFNEILDVCDRTQGPGWLQDAVVSSFKLERESFGNGKLVVSDEILEDSAPNATFVAKRPGWPVFVYYFDEGRPAREEPYDEESYYQIVRLGGDLDGDFILPGERSRADFMRGIVGANKRIHEKTTRFDDPLTRIQFLYLKGLEGACLLQCAEDCRVSISNLTVQARGSEIWTINRVAVRGRSIHSDFRICYRSALQTPPVSRPGRRNEAATGRS